MASNDRVMVSVVRSRTYYLPFLFGVYQQDQRVWRIGLIWWHIVVHVADEARGVRRNGT